MQNEGTTSPWTDKDVRERLEAVRQSLLDFLRERTRLDWFKHKVRWRLSRQYIWPGAPDDFRQLLDEKVERDVGVEAFIKHLSKEQRTITRAIERYNYAVRRQMEEELGVPVSQFDALAMDLLRQKRITFQGVRDELLRLAKGITPESGPEYMPELLSLRLAILSGEARDQVFRDATAIVADEASYKNPEMGEEERHLYAWARELRLRCLDTYHVAKLLASNYPEGRRLISLDKYAEQHRQLVEQQKEADEPDPIVGQKLELLAEILQKKIAFLEQIFPTSKGTHQRELSLLRRPPVQPTA